MDSRKYFIVSVAVIAIATGAWLSIQVLAPPPTLQKATLLPAPADLSEFSLQDQDNNLFERGSFEGRWSLVFFGFTHCPDVCPITLQVLSNARQQLLAEGHNELPRIVLVSVDPERDTPEILARYVTHFGDDTIGLTGELAEVRKLTDGLGVFFEKSGNDENYSVDHSAVVIVVNPDGQFHALFGAPHEAEFFVHDLPILMSGR